MKYSSRFGYDLEPSEGSVGYDVRTPHIISIPEGYEVKVNTGIVAEPPEGYFFMAVLRSSAGCKKDLMIKNGIGIIDPIYCGNGDEIILHLRRAKAAGGIYVGIRDGDNVITPEGAILYDALKHWSFRTIEERTAVYENVRPLPSTLYDEGERFAQLLLMPYISPDLERVDVGEMGNEDRGGFGSTGDL